jgi:hypothetical protein
MPNCGWRKKRSPNVTLLDVQLEEFRPDDELLAFLKGLGLCRVRP